MVFHMRKKLTKNLKYFKFGLTLAAGASAKKSILKDCGVHVVDSPA